MKQHPDCKSYLFQDEDRRMAGIQARKEEEKKRESHKQTIHKVPLSWFAPAVFVYPDLAFNYAGN